MGPDHKGERAASSSPKPPRRHITYGRGLPNWVARSTGASSVGQVRGPNGSVSPSLAPVNPLPHVDLVDQRTLRSRWTGGPVDPNLLDHFDPVTHLAIGSSVWSTFPVRSGQRPSRAFRVGALWLPGRGASGRCRREAISSRGTVPGAVLQSSKSRA